MIRPSPCTSYIPETIILQWLKSRTKRSRFQSHGIRIWWMSKRKSSLAGGCAGYKANPQARDETTPRSGGTVVPKARAIGGPFAKLRRGDFFPDDCANDGQPGSFTGSRVECFMSHRLCRWSEPPAIFAAAGRANLLGLRSRGDCASILEFSSCWGISRVRRAVSYGEDWDLLALEVC